MASPEFSTDRMLAAASAETGLDDFGDEAFREGLSRLVRSTNEDVELSPMGAAVLEADVHRLLVNRLRAAADFRAHPEILVEEIDDPIVILGMPRTGTTKLQRYTSADPGLQSLTYWKLLNVARMPSADQSQEDPRVEIARQGIAAMAAAMPKWMDSHPTGAEDADEDVFLQLYSFKCVLFYMFRPVPGYQRWIEGESLRDTYAYEKQLLQYLQWQDGGRRDRPWLLKTPVHLGSTDLLVETFPKATLVFLHRDLHEVIPSHCRLMESTRGLYCPTVDMHDIGRACVGDFSVEMTKHLRIRDEMGDALDILDVSYDRVVRDIEGVVEEIYARAGREVTPAALEAMRAWEAGHPRHHAGSYSYSMDDYGLTPEYIDEAFREYNERFASV